MPRLPSRTSKQIIRLIESRGFELDHITGSHYIYYHPLNGRRVTIPQHNRTLPKGTLISILKEADISRDSL